MNINNFGQSYNLSYRKNKRDRSTFEEDIEKDIINKELLNEAPSEKIVLDIQDTRRYFESQTGGQDELKINEPVSKGVVL